MRIGLGLDGSEIEIVGALLENGEWLAYHAMTPLTKEMMHEIACAQYESGTWDGRLDCIPVGPAAIADEPLVTVTVKFPASMIAAVDERSSDRFAYIRRAVAAAIFADACEMAAEWLQGECEYQAIHDEPFPKQTFGNQPKNGGKVVIVAVNADKGTVRKVNASRAAEMLGVTKGRVSQMVKANQLEAFRDGGHCLGDAR